VSVTTTQETRRIEAAERRRFDQDGWLLIPGALPSSLRERLVEATDRVYTQEAFRDRLGPHQSLSLPGFLSRDNLFLELLDLPTTFPYVWGPLGWNIYTHHCQLEVTPTVAEAGPPSWSWHRDGTDGPEAGDDPRHPHTGVRAEAQAEPPPGPARSVTVVFALSDLSELGRGNPRIIPGSHLLGAPDRPERPELGFAEPAGAMDVLAQPGDALVLDGRLWRSRGINISGITRKALSIGYTHRWVPQGGAARRDRDRVQLERLSPVRRQLLGVDLGGDFGVDLGGESAPLRESLRAQGLLDRSIRGRY
jgi:Phytanoyl-CoA dioxygenase (PhyH)